MEFNPTEPISHESARRVADFVASTRWERLPAEVQRKARMTLMDNLGSTLAGTVTPVSRITAEHAAESWAGDEATILMHGRRASAVGAAFANAWSANALDVDDGVQYAFGHAGAQLFPAALAVAETRHLGGDRLLAALVVGYEIAHRAGRCWHDDRTVYQACGSWGSVASAAAAANLFDLTPDQAHHALGIADYFAPNVPMLRDIDHPTMVKHGIGWGAMTGVTSAQLARRGFTGIPNLMAFDRRRNWMHDLGSEYLMVDGVGWKAYACCSFGHAAMNAAQKVVEENRLAVDQIGRIVVEGPDQTARLPHRLPETTEEAQFNVAWPLAALLVDGEVGPAQMVDTRLHDPAIRCVAERVEIVENAELNELCRLRELGHPKGEFAAIVTIHMADGRSFCSGVVGAGSTFPQAGWDETRLERKFRWLCDGLLPQACVDELTDLVWHFEYIGDVTRLIQALATCAGSGMPQGER